MITKINKKSKLSVNQYVNQETGELLESEFPGAISINQDTDYVVLDYKEYVVMDKKVMQFLKQVLSKQEIGRILVMSATLQQTWNIIMNEEYHEPHTYETLSEDMCLTRNRYHDFMQKMYKASIVFKLKGYWKGVERTMFILNPHLVRATKSTHKELLLHFENLTKPSVQKKIKELLNSL